MDWRPISELNQCNDDISEYGYSKEYIEHHSELEEKDFLEWCYNTNRTSFSEPVEVMEKDDVVYYRENPNHYNRPISEVFKTQLCIFDNHNRGEFGGHLERHVEEAEDREFTEEWPLIDNICDMFDCGNYTYAIGNKMHGWIGVFRIYRIDKEFHYTTVYSTIEGNRFVRRLEYVGSYEKNGNYYVMASGYKESDKSRYTDGLTVLLKIEKTGDCKVLCEWDKKLSHTNSFAIAGSYGYLGQNKMVTKIDLISGETIFMTTKSNAEIAELRTIY